MANARSAPSERDPLLLGNSCNEVSTEVAEVEAIQAAALISDVEEHRTSGCLTKPVLPRSIRIGILTGLWLATFLSSANSTLVATVYPTISSEFHQSHRASWLGTSYLLATCAFTPLYGRVCDISGRRVAMQAAIFFAALGTLGCGFSNSMEVLVCARFIGGIGCGGILITATIVTSDVFSPRMRGLTQGCAMVVNSIGMGLGGPIGGFTSDWFGWRWVFLIQMPLFCLSFAVVSYYLQYPTPHSGKDAGEMFKRIDYLGTATLLGSVLCVLVFLSNHYSEQIPWSSYKVYTPFMFAAVLSAGFILVELFVASDPVLAPPFLKHKVLMLISLSNFFIAICNFSVLYYYPMWFQTVQLTKTGEAGAHLIPNGISFSAGSLFSGWLIHRTGKYKVLDAVLGILSIVGASSLVFIHKDSPPIQLWFSIIPLGFGTAVALQAMLVARLAHLPDSAIALGTGFCHLFRGLGQVSGVAISSAIFQSSLDRELRRRINGKGSEEIIAKIRRSSKLVEHLPYELQRSARDSYAASLRYVFVTAAVASLLAYIIRLPIPDKCVDERKSDGEQSVERADSL